MARNLEDVEEDIYLCTNKCVADRKKGFAGFWRSRKNQEPQCNANCRNTYKADLDAARTARDQQDDLTRDSYLGELSGENAKKFYTAAGIIGFIILVLIIIFY